MSIHEECGVFGVFAPEPCDVARISYYGLYALQHRGQESCGIVVNDDGVFVSHKDMGADQRGYYTGYSCQDAPKHDGGGSCKIWNHRRHQPE